MGSAYIQPAFDILQGSIKALPILSHCFSHSLAYTLCAQMRKAVNYRSVSMVRLQGKPVYRLSRFLRCLANWRAYLCVLLDITLALMACFLFGVILVHYFPFCVFLSKCAWRTAERKLKSAVVFECSKAVHLQFPTAESSPTSGVRRFVILFRISQQLHSLHNVNFRLQTFRHS